MLAHDTESTVSWKLVLSQLPSVDFEGMPKILEMFLEKSPHRLESRMNVLVVFEVIAVAPLEVLNAGTPAASACAHNFAGAGFET